ncbi:hypothetical protein GOV05_03000 [Candidatus Woesearchaeota archaeon]|nr:hypothetical protein [Candidatus Woesearchaeota archaeon]
MTIPPAFGNTYRIGLSSDHITSLMYEGVEKVIRIGAKFFSDLDEHVRYWVSQELKDEDPMVLMSAGRRSDEPLITSFEHAWRLLYWGEPASDLEKIFDYCIGHEFAHHILGHTRGKQPKYSNEKKEQMFNERKEIDTDAEVIRRGVIEDYDIICKYGFMDEAFIEEVLSESTFDSVFF